MSKNLVNGGKALKAAVILGAALQVYSAYAASGQLVDAMHDYKRDAERGADTATMDLDAVAAAVAVQEMTSDYFVTMWVMSNLMQ